MPIIRLGRITETPVPRTATTSTKLAPRVSRPRRRCGVAFRIINAATSSGTREPARHPFPAPVVPALVAAAGEVGVIAPGKLADIVIWDKDPIADITVLQARPRPRSSSRTAGL